MRCDQTKKLKRTLERTYILYLTTQPAVKEPRSDVMREYTSQLDWDLVDDALQKLVCSVLQH